MNLIIDKENWESLIQSRQSNIEFYDTCELLMKKQLDVKFNFLKSDVTDNLSKTILSRFLAGFGESKKIEFGENKVPLRPISFKNCQEWGWNEYSSVFMISDENISNFKKKKMVLMCEEGEELKTLRCLFCGEDDSFDERINPSRMSLSSWKQIFETIKPKESDTLFPLPCSDIVISDRYLFKNQKELVEVNLCELLSCLTECDTKDDRSKVNIVIFTIDEYLKKFDVDTAKKIINKAIEKSTGKKANITFVTSHDSDKINHDRFIFTNYHKIESGDSFIYFDTSGKFISKGMGLHIYSLAKKENYDDMKATQKELNEIVETINKANSDCIIGDRKSNFIKF